MHQHFRMWPVMVALLIGLGGVAGSAYAQEFSAEQTTISGAKKEVDRLYYRPDRWRMEAKDGASPEITIFRLDKKVIWQLLPKEKKYVEMPLSSEDLPVPERIVGEMDRKITGQEEVEGLLCDKLVVRYSTDRTADGVAEMCFWISQELKVPIRTEAPDLEWRTELKNIKVGPQADELFEIPQGYECFEPPFGSFIR